MYYSRFYYSYKNRWLIKPPYLYKLNTTTYTANSTFSIANAGNYYGYIKDSLGCLARTTVIAMPVPTGCGGPTLAKPAGNTKEANNQPFTVSLSPNPSSNQFTIIAHSTNIEPVSIRVIDAIGRSFYAVKAQPGQPFRFGDRLLAGSYWVEVRQGNEMKIIKAVKGR